MPKKQRIYKWDNLKALLIFLAVLGHFVDEVTPDSRNMQILYFYIYIFHMPLFLYMSGMFAWNSVRDPRKRRERIIGYILLGVLLKFLVLITKLFMGVWDPGDFKLLKMPDLSWYLFALAAFIALTWFLRDLDQRFLLVIAFLCALFVGYDNTINTKFALSRIFVFYPYFLMGYHTNPYMEQWREMEKPRWRAVSAVFLLAVLVIVARKIDVLIGYQDLLLGWKNYDTISQPGYGFWFRLLTYAVAILMSLAVISLTPRNRTPISYMGRRSLPIYFLHRPVIYILVLGKGMKLLKHLIPGHWRLIFILLSVPVTVILSTAILDRPFQWFWRMIGANAEKNAAAEQAREHSGGKKQY